MTQFLALQALQDIMQSALAQLPQPGHQKAATQMDADSFADLFSRGLQEVADIAARACNEQNQQQKTNLAAALTQWLASLPGGQHNLSNVSPEILLIFLKMAWMPLHGKTQCPDGSIGPAAKSLQNAVSALSTIFKLQGRSHEWGKAPSEACNPCNSEAVKTFLIGYTKTLAAAGQEPKGAVPLTQDKVVRLLTRLYLEAMQPVEMGIQHATTAQLLAARDGLAFAFAWAAACRCINSCELRLENFTVHATSQPAAPLLFPRQSLPAGTVIDVTPDFLRKRSPMRNYEDIQLALPMPTDRLAMLLSPITWLRIVMQMGERAKSPVASLLVRPLTSPCSISFKETFLAKSSLQDRLTRTLQLVHSDAGETLHSFRRGRAVTERQAGASAEELQKLLMLSTTKQVALYSAPNRHKRRAEDGPG